MHPTHKHIRRPIERLALFTCVWTVKWCGSTTPMYRNDSIVPIHPIDLLSSISFEWLTMHFLDPRLAHGPCHVNHYCENLVGMLLTQFEWAPALKVCLTKSVQIDEWLRNPINDKGWMFCREIRENRGKLAQHESEIVITCALLKTLVSLDEFGNSHQDMPTPI